MSLGCTHSCLPSGHCSTLWQLWKWVIFKTTLVRTAVPALTGKWDLCFCFNLGWSLMGLWGLNLKMELDLQGINVLLMLCIMCGSNSCDECKRCKSGSFYVINIVLQSARMQENGPRYFLCVQLKSDMSDLITLVMHILHFFSSLFTPPPSHTPCCNAWWAGSILCMTPATSVGRCQLSFTEYTQPTVVTCVCHWTHDTTWAPSTFLCTFYCFNFVQRSLTLVLFHFQTTSGLIFKTFKEEIMFFFF